MFDITKITNRQQPGEAEVIAEPGCPKSGELHGRDVRQAKSHACCGEPVKIKSVGSQELSGGTKAHCLQDRKTSRISEFWQEDQGSVDISSGLTIKRKRVEPQLRPLSNGSDADSAPRKRTKIEPSTSGENRTVGTECDEPSDKSEDVLAKKITERLKALKVKYRDQFEFIKNNSTTRIFNLKDSTKSYTVKTRGNKMGHFRNEYKPDQWRFLDNQKGYEYLHTHDFYASNVVAHQYEFLSELNQEKNTLPKTIINMGIINQKSIQVIHEYAGRHDSEEFKHIFLATTDNGKRTARVANDFDLIIEGLKVNYEQFEEHAKSFSESELPEVKAGYDKFNVTFRVSPNPEVYGTRQDLDVSS